MPFISIAKEKPVTAYLVMHNEKFVYIYYVLSKKGRITRFFSSIFHRYSTPGRKDSSGYVIFMCSSNFLASHNKYNNTNNNKVRDSLGGLLESAYQLVNFYIYVDMYLAFLLTCRTVNCFLSGKTVTYIHHNVENHSSFYK